MDVDESLSKFTLVPDNLYAPQIRVILLKEVSKERRSLDTVDTELMLLCCVQLFAVGCVEDSLLIWKAKTSSMDCDGGIDIQLLCGAGLEKTKRFLSRHRTDEATNALERIVSCEACGEFSDFSTESWLGYYRNYYGIE